MASDENAETVAAERAAESGPGPTTAFEQQAIADAQRFKVVAIIAGALLAPQVLAHLLLPWFAMPAFSSMYQTMGVSVPSVTVAVLWMGPWLGVLFALIDVLVFWGFYRLARTYWIGLLFAPLFVLGILSSTVIAALYLPTFEVISLVK
jgi:hypothetical protein